MSEAAFPAGFLSEAIQVCTVSRDYRKAIAGFLKLGIGPWQVHRFSPATVSEMTYRSKPSPHVMMVCLASLGRMEWEIIQPVEGPTIYEEFLARHGESAHHIAVRCASSSWADKIARFEAQGFRVVQSGSWLGRMPYAYFDTEAATGTTFEIYDEQPGFVMPEPEEWWPAAGDAQG
jgi:methylmalonyl-CoA/ethylmalonyl-CoA epimerase